MKVLIVDDSIVYRSAISQALETVPGIIIAKSVSNGELAVKYLQDNADIDLITLDMEMPVLDGMETIRQVRKFNRHVTIIVFSSFTKKGAERTIKALSIGADDFVEKVEGTGSIEGSISMIRKELVPRIEALQKRSFSREQIENTIKDNISGGVEIENIVMNMSLKPKLICLGCSTGGPEALTSIFKTITENLTIPMVIVQHMPPMFTQKLAEMLDKLSPIEVREAQHGDTIRAGLCLIAPGDYHMEITPELKVKLNQDEKVCFVRPAVDVLFKSISRNFTGQVLSIILTGMGDDGANGCIELKKRGAYQFIQDESSCIVWGMPGAVSRTGINPTTLKLDQFGKLLNLVSKRV
ncbi:chemotaxis-specific protein-glutamate methyltransferase CheB [Halobacteriovorax sp. HLS]|uniref:chemotaxis-specific protein-glutamate methyltransferase CheB n=1 Tax=Halobacteriovorax sp. HLS TaxID=2234000 RepID=UPI000FDB4088|nr:chemotaxis-specific protein-glutamate methyltransferase CheB [Halobacteriovorax sp. HLS]